MSNEVKRSLAKRIRIFIGSLILDGELGEGPATEVLWENLPVEGKGNRWGDEIYVYVPFELPCKEGQEVVDPGTIAYWPEGPAICIFWGPTPVSRRDECRAYSPVSVLGKITSDLSYLKRAAGDLRVRIERAKWVEAS